MGNWQLDPYHTQVEFSAKHLGMMTVRGYFNDPGMMGHRIAYSATTKINRKDFGLNFNMILDGRLIVSEEIQIMIEGELVEQQEAAETASS